MYNGCESVKCNAVWGCKESMKPSEPKSVDNLQNALTYQGVKAAQNILGQNSFFNII